MSELVRFQQQFRRSLTIARKDIQIYYAKGPVIIYGVLMPIFLFLAFTIGRSLPADLMIPGLLGMILFFTATAVSPIIVPWEAQARTLERLMSTPVKLETIILGDILASFIFGAGISIVPIIIGLTLGITIASPGILALAIILSSFCFAALGNVFSTPPTNTPATVNMIAAGVRFPIVFMSGVFIPLDELPIWGQNIAFISPLTYFIDIARNLMHGQGHLPLVIDFLAIIGFTAVFLIVAMKLHRRTMPRRI
ncbi:MAG: ABC transporter permease [Dehalococcoidales bacterium]|nr:ABC transporter permease [Dehalococcoidales bacterium]